MIRPTRALINLGAIRHNVRSVLEFIGPGRKVLVMVKADGYGHGAVPVAKTALAAGASYCGVALVEEAIGLRQAGIQSPIIVFTSLPPHAAQAVVEHDLTPVVCSLSFAAALNEAAISAGKKQSVHVDVDTGMGRIGFRIEDPGTIDNIRTIAAMKGLSIQGLMTHLSCADEEDSQDFTKGQLALVNELLETLASSGIRPQLVHVANTAGILYHPDSHHDMVRLGLGLYGYYPSAEAPRTVKLEPALELVSAIVHLKTCAPGSTIGYGRTFIAKRPTCVATVPVGYGDGYPRELSNRGKVIVGSADGKTRTVCPVIGRVCMDDILVDVTDAPGVAVADQVVVYSSIRDDANSVESSAAIIGTIPYTLTTQLTSRIPRVYVGT